MKQFSSGTHIDVFLLYLRQIPKTGAE